VRVPVGRGYVINVRERIQGSPEAQAWRLAHLAEYRALRSWMIRQPTSS
jgi:hypothetical protein